MHYTVKHKTTYKYHDSVGICHNLAWLVPRNTERQQCENYQLHISPEPAVINAYEDYFGNKVLYFAIQDEHEQLEVEIKSRLTIDDTGNNLFEMYATVPWEQVLADLKRNPGAHLEALQYVPPTAMTPSSDDVLAFTLISFTPGRPMLEALADLNKRIFTEFRFHPGFTTIATPVSVVLKERKGVCQDFAHLAIACMRSIGIPARYISGYIETLPPPGKEKLKGVDASHAWFSVYLPNAGWFEYDPTNNQVPGSQHITIGWGRDYNDLPPMKGVILSSGKHELKVSVDVRRTVA